MRSGSDDMAPKHPRRSRWGRFSRATGVLLPVLSGTGGGQLASRVAVQSALAAHYRRAAVVPSLGHPRHR